MRQLLTIGEFGVMKGMSTVQMEQFVYRFSVASLWNSKAADGIPATNDFDADIMSEGVLVLFPFGIVEVTLVSIPDTSGPVVGCRFSLQNAELAYHSGETATDEAATGETKEE